jgi:hypothetical protein
MSVWVCVALALVLYFCNSAEIDFVAQYAAIISQAYPHNPLETKAVVDSARPSASSWLFRPASRCRQIREAAPRLCLVGAFPPRKHTTVAFTP